MDARVEPAHDEKEIACRPKTFFGAPAKDEAPPATRPSPLRWLAASALALVLASPAALACSPAPLLQPGKTQLQERVLTRPGGKLTPDGGAAKPVPGFSVLYVYERSPDGARVRVGASADCKPEGWMPAEAVVPWRHTLVGAFANRTGRDRVLFFGAEDGLRSLVGSRDAGAQAAKLAEAAKTAGPGQGAAGPLVSIEPETPVDINKQFYLLPILEAKTQRFPTGRPVRMVKVAAVTSRDQGAPAPASAASATPAPPPAPAIRQNFRTAIVFVIDASSSMQPYIDRTREAIKRIYDGIKTAQLQEQVRFGLIGYRDDPKAVPGLEYLTKVFVDPNKVDTREEFDRAAAGLAASKVSTRAFAEDGYAGIDSAINAIDWSPFGGRFVVLITDASSRDPGSLSATGLDAKALSIALLEKKIATMALHLLTEEGRKDHAKGAAQYRELTTYPGRKPLYYPVEAGDVGRFGARVDTLTDSLVTLVQAAEAGEGLNTPPPPTPKAAPGKPASNPGGDPLAEDIAAIGHAMRLAYLGSVKGTAAPPMFEAWAADRDFANDTVASLDVRVLLSKSQLSDLQATVGALADAYSKGQVDPSDLFNQLRSAAATLSRDPAKVGTSDNRALNQALLGEYLDGLPYTSRVMAIDQDAWLGMNPGEQQALIDDLQVKARLYRRFHDDVSNWVRLAEGASPEDAVYPVPLTALP
ncbi:VWA domain-containing protein [Skermanella sp. TT6]|uniref:VWA domain-containing protein n=1 Tax=Skermanella cutis TaxID=2775420 RepID=A0ABX7B9R1_9PROT|nr:vWA domain-containing protein [Skermanella sp. TT6]QQP89207.1 VWA domain-containing protein [Skermanella sp. TT6]